MKEIAAKPRFAKVRALLSRLRADEAGTTAVEYAIIGGFLSIAIVASVDLLGPSVLALYTAVIAVL